MQCNEVASEDSIVELEFLQVTWLWYHVVFVKHMYLFGDFMYALLSLDFCVVLFDDI
jgi:hypothetical protein